MSATGCTSSSSQAGSNAVRFGEKMLGRYRFARKRSRSCAVRLLPRPRASAQPAMNLDRLQNGQKITVQDAALRPGELPRWTRPRGTRVYLSTPRVHPRVDQICISIGGSGVFSASEFSADLQALVSDTKPTRVTRILGVIGPWREARHPDEPGRRMARPIQTTPPKALP